LHPFIQPKIRKRYILIKAATPADCKVLAKLAAEIWHTHTADELNKTFKDTINDPNSICFIKRHKNIPIGFAQCSLRHDYVEGTHTSPVGYLEGIFIEEKFRGKGYAAELLKACEIWAKSMGCKEFASDCELTNNQSLNFHLATGFTETNRIICFKKDI